MENVQETIDDKYEILKPLGQGYTANVYLAKEIQTKEKLALKMYKPKGNKRILSESFLNEVNSMKKVNCPNVVKIIDANEKGDHKKNGIFQRQAMYMCVELCLGGEFFDYICIAGKGFTENTTRHYFSHIIIGLKAIHDVGLSHRDLKTENIFVDNSLNIKIGDFGFAKFTEKDGSDIFYSLKGTQGYQCPELVAKVKYSGPSNDIFACGVILFILYTGFPPFKEARIEDPWYKNFFNKTTDDFWKMHISCKRTPYISESFKELINGMFSVDNRYTLNEVITSKWMTESKVDENAAKEELEQRKKMLDDEKNKISEQIQVEDSNESSENWSGNQIFRDTEDDTKAELEEFQKTFKSIQFGELEISSWKGCEYLSNNYLRFKLTPKRLLEEICTNSIINYPGVKVNLREQGYKGNFNLIPTSDELDKIEDITLFPLILDVDFEIYEEGNDSVIHFSKNSEMNHQDFRKFLSKLKKVYGI